MLFTIKRILVCSDLSPNSDQVILNAEILRKRTGAKLDVLHVAESGPDFESKLSKQLESLDIKAELMILNGEATEKINETITSGKIKYDLLMIGHNSRSGLFHHLLGSVAKKILSSVSIPTLIIKNELQFNKLGCLIDNTSPMGWMITSSLDFYRVLKFEHIQFINLWHGDSGSLSEFRDRLHGEIQYFEREKENVSIRVEATKELQVSGHLYEILKEEKVNLTIMKRNRGKNMKTLILGSETMRMLEMENLNLLILPV